MKTRVFAIIILVLLLAYTISACSSGGSSSTAASTTTLEGATLVQQRCSVCHTLARIESSHYTAAEWKTIVDTMISRGAQLTPEEETVVVNYLAVTYGK